jgi:hypothetical protein
MSISKVKALRSGAEAVVLAKDAKHNVNHNCLSNLLGQTVKPLTFPRERSAPLFS